MLIYHRTSLLDSNAQTVVNTVNCVGVMGKGIAAAFKARYPSMFDTYRQLCSQGAIQPGKLWLWRGPEQWVLNFPTKKHWRNSSRLEWIEAGLAKFIGQYQRRGITEISFPRLGCGNGNLDWADVRPIMEKYLATLPINIYIHDFEHDIGIPEHLEAAAQTLESSTTFDGSFSAFLRDLRIAISAVGNDLVDLDTGEPFKASMLGDNLTIETAQQVSQLDDEDLRGVWVTLARGMLTQDQVGWSSGSNATHLLSLVSLLPCTKAIQIQRQKSAFPELAVEFRRSPGATGTPELGEAPALAWH
jgi:O-acetyl-ADP-ribose deacetylase (regulator of RNase III)